jgi:outer membrane lipoprotein SlyB
MQEIRVLHAPADSLRRRAAGRHRGDIVSLQRLVVRAAAAGWMAAAASGAIAVAVDGVNVEQVIELGAGVPLNFSVFGTPGAAAVLCIEGGWRVLALRETEPGIYEGSYVIDPRDKIAPASRVTATLQRGGSVAEARLEGPLVLPKGPLPWADAAAATAAPRPIPVTPPSAAPIPASPSNAAPMATAVPPAHEAPSTVGPPRPWPQADGATRLARAAEPTPCADCATVESVRPVKEAPTGGAIGAIAGTIAGAILGEEIAEAHRQRMLGLLGALGGALGGREIERQATRATHYEVVFRRADGSRLTRRYDRAPPFAPGETVRLDGAGERDAPAAAPF